MGNGKREMGNDGNGKREMRNTKHPATARCDDKEPGLQAI